MSLRDEIPLPAFVILMVLATLLALYITFLLLGIIPIFQRNFVYAYKLSSTRFCNLNNPASWGFAKNQIAPFSIPTPDGQTLYAWHILSAPSYLKNEEALLKAPTGFCEDPVNAESFRILRENPNRRVVIFSDSWRPYCYHSLASSPNNHVFTFDYRGFGHSTGHPTEEGLIQDGKAVIEWVMNVAGVPSKQIVLFSHSLGTAVVSGALGHFHDKGIEFAGVLLTSPFSNLPMMLRDYRIKGIMPVLLPLKPLPFMIQILQKCIWEQWRSDQRLARIVANRSTKLRLTMLHACNDFDIPCAESGKIVQAIVDVARRDAANPTSLTHDANAHKNLHSVEEENGPAEEGSISADDFKTQHHSIVEDGKERFVETWSLPPNTTVRRIQISHGGHNRIIAHEDVFLSILRFFEEAERADKVNE